MSAICVCTARSSAVTADAGHSLRGSPRIFGTPWDDVSWGGAGGLQFSCDQRCPESVRAFLAPSREPGGADSYTNITNCLLWSSAARHTQHWPVSLPVSLWICHIQSITFADANALFRRSTSDASAHCNDTTVHAAKQHVVVGEALNSAAWRTTTDGSVDRSVEHRGAHPKCQRSGRCETSKIHVAEFTSSAGSASLFHSISCIANDVACNILQNADVSRNILATNDVAGNILQTSCI